MSQFVSGEEVGQQGQISALHDAFEFLCNDLKTTFPTMAGQLEGLTNQLRQRMRMMQDGGAQSNLYGGGPRATVLKAVYGAAVAETMIAAELPVKRADTDTEEYRKQLHPSQVANQFLSTVRLGESNGYHRWSFDQKCEDLGSLYCNAGINEIFHKPALAKEGVYRGRIGDNNGYNNDFHTLVVRYKPDDGTKTDVLVLIGSINGTVHYYVYVPLEDTWVLANTAQFVDVPTVNHRIIELLQQADRNLVPLSLEQAFTMVWDEAERLELLHEPSQKPWDAPTSWDDKRSWSKAEFNYAFTGSRDPSSGSGYGDFLQLALRRDVFTLRRWTVTGLDGYKRLSFECNTQSLRNDWDRIPLRIRHELVAEYMTALAVAAAEMATAQLIDQPATAEAEA